MNWDFTRLGGRRYGRPSSTITAAGLTGAGVTFFWYALMELTSISVSAVFISTSAVFLSTLVGYLKRENVLPVERHPYERHRDERYPVEHYD